MSTTLERNDGVGGSLTWTADYGSLVAAVYDMMTVDGINEAGLSGHILWRDPQHRPAGWT